MKNFVLLLRVNTNMDPGAFTDPREVADRAKWLEDVKEKGIVSDRNQPLAWETVQRHTTQNLPKKRKK